MKMILCLLVACLGYGALPPFAQSRREMEALLQDFRLYQAVGSGEAIREISRNEEGYFILTTHYAMQVDIEYVPRKDQRAGPAEFILNFYEPIANEFLK